MVDAISIEGLEDLLYAVLTVKGTVTISKRVLENIDRSRAIAIDYNRETEELIMSLQDAAEMGYDNEA